MHREQKEEKLKYVLPQNLDLVKNGSGWHTTEKIASL